MNGLLLASNPNSKDINFKSEKIQNIELKEQDTKEVFFQSVMENMLQNFPDDSKRALVIAKIADLPSDLQRKEQVVSLFSGEKLFTDHQIDEVSIETLIDIAALLNSSPQAPLDFPTDSKALKTSLLDLNVQKALKSAKTVGDILKIAEQNGIKVKNFKFFKEESALDNSTKAMVKKINSAEIFNLMAEQKTKHIHINRPGISHTNLKPHAEHTPGILNEILKKSNTVKTDTDKTAPPAPKSVNRVSASIQTIQEKPSPTPQMHIKTAKTDMPQNANPAKSLMPQQRAPADMKPLHAESTPKTAKTPATPIQTLQEKPSPAPQMHIKTAKTDMPQNANPTKTLTPQQSAPAQRQPVHADKTATAAPKPSDTLSVPIQTLQDKPSPIQQVHITATSTKTIQQPVTVSKHEEKRLVTSTADAVSSDMQEPLHRTVERRDAAAANMNQTQSLLQKDMHINRSAETVEKPVAHHTPLSAAGSEMQNETREHQKSAPHEEQIVSHATQTKYTQTSKMEPTPLKKTFHNFAQEFQEKVESYKPPLMKIKMQLNPGNLGDVDVTLINRGHNLHVNINANPSTIAIFAQNQTEFKNALINMGFTGLQMQFGDNREQRGQNQRDPQKQHQFSDDDTVETDHFDLIVPRYV